MSIVCCNVWKKFGNIIALHPFTETIQETGVTVLMGSSGAGKTTLLKILAGLYSPDGGEITGLSNMKVSMVFQEDRLLPWLSALQNVTAIYPNQKQAVSMLSALGLEEQMNMSVSDLSGGMQRRVAIARALCAPFDLLLDEPFDGQDEQTKQQVMNIIKPFAKTKSIVFVTHNKEEAATFGDHFIYCLTRRNTPTPPILLP